MLDRVFCVGINKSGTSTMKHCFSTLGLTPIAAPPDYSFQERRAIRKFYTDRKYFELLKIAKKYRAFEDRPWNMWDMYRHLDEHFSNSKFILTERDPDSWWRSTERWINVTKPDVFDIYLLHLGVKNPTREAMIAAYIRYNQEVKDYFYGTNKLLTLNFEEGDEWGKLCEFLDLPVPNENFPHMNRQLYTEQDSVLLEESRRFRNTLVCQSCNSVRVNRPDKKSTPSAVFALRKKRILRSLSPGNTATGLRQFKVMESRYGELIRKGMSLLYRLQQSVTSCAPSMMLRESTSEGRRPGEKELAVVSCFFNPAGSDRRVENFQAFLQGIKISGVKCLVVELAFGDNPFQIEGHSDIIRLRSDTILWHKERLLNIGISRLLAEGFKKIAWLDGDIVFEDSSWPSEISRRLDRANLCQVFSDIGVAIQAQGTPAIGRSAVKYYRESGMLYQQPGTRLGSLAKGYLRGGHPGFGWAARAEILRRVPLFDNAIVGGGDRLIMAASLEENLSCPALPELTRSRFSCRDCGHHNSSVAYTQSYLQWARNWSRVVDGKVDYARLNIRDMYHGNRNERGYATRNEILYRHQFDPEADLQEDEVGCIAWSSDKPQLHKDIEAYFLSRKEDS